ncbi:MULTISPECIES: glycosyltransferase family 4 protein [unclassified Cobetia]|uniref:glycosyltransferase family 4 protein n=1 Tax=unclassified Cobetia TaxID=2609414 RepID=UPI00178CC79B|nr:MULTISPECIES: glycosyltransferase family 4 protein [unclassified Cobetia]MBE2170228.1 glycosyltransferase family 4 protein [Cobetia sp. 2AS1]MDH2446990.1 glycosyltransferase family 4 protein [Cobetia sp. 2AS]
MKLGIVLEHWGLGGTETYVEGLVKHLDKCGYDVYIITLKKDAEHSIKFIKKDRVFVCDKYKLPALISSLDLRLLNLHLYTSLLPIAALAKIKGVKVVSTLHMPLNSWGIKIRISWIIACLLSDTIVGVSRLVIKQIERYQAWPHPLPGGIDNIFLSKSRKFKYSTETYRIAAIGRLSSEKDWGTLIDAVAMLVDNIKEKITIDFYGDGTLQKVLYEIAQENKVNVCFHGHLSKEDLVEELDKNFLSVLPSKFEGLGLSAVESMAAGLPMITSNFEAANDFIENMRTGHIFEFNNHKQLSNLILWHIDNPIESKEIAKAGQVYAKNNFSPSVVYSGYIEIFKKYL